MRTVAEEDAGWSRLLVNRVVIDEQGRRIGEVDLVECELDAAIEVDGADHRSGRQQAWDITKEEALRQAGFELTRATGRQSLDRAALAARLVAVRRRAQARPRSARRWRLAPESFDLEAWLSAREATALLWEAPPRRHPR